MEPLTKNRITLASWVVCGVCALLALSSFFLWHSLMGLILCLVLAVDAVLVGAILNRKEPGYEDVDTRNLHAITALCNFAGFGFLFYQWEHMPTNDGMGLWLILIVALGSAGILQLSYIASGWKEKEQPVKGPEPKKRPSI